MRIWIIAFSLVALASILASAAFAGCASCQRMSAEAFGLPIQWPAIGFYAAFSALALWGRGRARSLLNLSGFGTGVHLFLLAALLRGHSFCLVCVWLAACSLACTLAVFLDQRRAVALAAGIFLGVLFSGHFVRTAGIHPLHEFQAIESQMHERLVHLNGVRTIFVFTSDECPVCTAFWRDDVPPLEKIFGNRLVIVRLPRAKETPTPTLVFATGISEPFVMFGRPPPGILQHIVALFLQ